MKIIVGGGGGSMWASRNIYVPRSSSNVFSRALHNAFYNLREREGKHNTYIEPVTQPDDLSRIEMNKTIVLCFCC